MKIALTSKGNDLESEMDMSFGRSKKFIVVDIKTDEYEVVDNTMNVNAAQGAGIQSGQNIAQSGAQAVVTGNIGPNAFRTLSEAGIKMYLTGKCTVREALQRFKDNTLEEQKDANVEGHWV